MSASHRARSRRIAGRQFGTILAALAVALTVAAVRASGASAATSCVYRTFGLSSTYQPCVQDEQVLLNDLWSIHVDGPNQRLTTDGYYGNNTANDVAHFNDWWLGFYPDWITPPVTWHWLCVLTGENGFEGAYWHAASCPLVDY